MIRKIAHTIIAFVLLIATGGFTMSKHYCADNLISVTFSAEAKACGHNNMGDCCHEESEHFQLKDDFVASNVNINLENHFYLELALLPVVFLNIESESGEKESIAYTDESPPPNIHTALAKLQTYLL